LKFRIRLSVNDSSGDIRCNSATSVPYLQGNAALAITGKRNGGKVRLAAIGATRSERLLSAIPVEMCMAQHLSLWGFLAFTPIDTNILTSSILLPKKNQSPFPRPTTRNEPPDGGYFWLALASPRLTT
jgi:hypothetical protein